MSLNPREDALGNVQPSDNELHYMLPSQLLFDETGASAAAATGTSSSAAEYFLRGAGTIDYLYLPVSMCISSVYIGVTAGHMQHEHEQELHLAVHRQIGQLNRLRISATAGHMEHE